MKKKFIHHSLLALPLLLTSCTTTEQSSSTERNHMSEYIELVPGKLKYKILTQGDPDSPGVNPGDKMFVHYTGWLDEKGKRGKKFDSSIDRRQPFTITPGAGEVIPGWEFGVMGMKKGEKRELVIAPEFGYGARGAGNVIPPNATLIFEIEYL